MEDLYFHLSHVVLGIVIDPHLMVFYMSRSKVNARIWKLKKESLFEIDINLIKRMKL